MATLLIVNSSPRTNSVSRKLTHQFAKTGRPGAQTGTSSSVIFPMGPFPT